MKTHKEVRFHLQAGENYKKWQVKVVRDGRKVEVRYFDPAEHRLELRGCRLVNKINKAKKVHEAGVKDVSGWIECDEVSLTRVPTEGLEKVFYNPIKNIHWRRESDEGEFAWDETEYHILVTNGRQVYILEERE